MGLKEALVRMVKVARYELKSMEACAIAGYNDETHFCLFGDVADAIYYLIGEKTETFDESVTCHVLRDESLDDVLRVNMLMEAYEKNHSAP